MDGRTNSFSLSILSSSRNLFIPGDFNCHHPSGTQVVLLTPAGRKYLTGSSPLTSSSSMTLTHPVLHCSSGSRSSPDISFAPSSLALCCSWEVLQDLGSDYLPILLSIPFSLVFRPNERPPSFSFQKAVVVVVITPPLPRDGGTARTAIQIHAVNLVEIRLGKSWQPISNQS